jgi:endonuclease YncB( thermonuclease family)
VYHHVDGDGYSKERIMMAATILCLVAQVPDGATLQCSEQTRIRIAGLEVGALAGTAKARGVLERLTLGKKVSCFPAGNEGPFIVAKCTLPDRRDLACALIASKAALRSDASWKRYGLGECG